LQTPAINTRLQPGAVRQPPPKAKAVFNSFEVERHRIDEKRLKF
jgi:hypothetical protein